MKISCTDLKRQNIKIKQRKFPFQQENAKLEKDERLSIGLQGIWNK